MHSTCPHEFFEEVFLEKKQKNFQSPLEFEPEAFGLSAKVFGTLVKTAFSVSRGMFRGFFELITFLFVTFGIYPQKTI